MSYHQILAKNMNTGSLHETEYMYVVMAISINRLKKFEFFGKIDFIGKFDKIDKFYKIDLVKFMDKIHFVEFIDFVNFIDKSISSYLSIKLLSSNSPIKSIFRSTIMLTVAFAVNFLKN